MREIYGVVKKDALSFMLKGNISQEMYDMIDFSEAKPDPLDFNLASLPSVPKSAVYEPLKTFTNPTTASQQILQPAIWKETWQPLNTKVAVSATPSTVTTSTSTVTTAREQSYWPVLHVAMGSMGLEEGFAMPPPGFGSMPDHEMQLLQMPQ